VARRCRILLYLMEVSILPRQSTITIHTSRELNKIPAPIWQAESLTPMKPCVDSAKALSAATLDFAVETSASSRWNDARAREDLSTAVDEGVLSERAMRMRISGTLCASFPKVLIEYEALSTTKFVSWDLIRV
jgi:hypothetical protein